MSLLRRSLAVLALGCISPMAAHASTPLTAAEILSQYNLVTSGNVSSSSDIGGAAVIGGTLSGNNTFLMDTTSSQSSSVNVYGKIGNNSHININNGGNLYYSGKGSLNGKVNFNGGAWVKSGPSLPLSDYITPLDNLSSSLASLTDTSNITLSNNTTFFNAVDGGNGLAVFDVSAGTLQTDLQNTSNISFNFGQGVTTAVVNVTGNSFSQPDNSNWNGSGLSNVLFNFTDATRVSIGNWQSSILAPKAAVTIKNGAMNGSLFASSFKGGGELHNVNFTGTLSSTVLVTTSSTKVPEPSSLALLGAGIAGLLGMARRRRR